MSEAFDIAWQLGCARHSRSFAISRDIRLVRFGGDVGDDIADFDRAKAMGPWRHGRCGDCSSNACAA